MNAKVPKTDPTADAARSNPAAYDATTDYSAAYPTAYNYTNTQWPSYPAGQSVRTHFFSGCNSHLNCR